MKRKRLPANTSSRGSGRPEASVTRSSSNPNQPTGQTASELGGARTTARAGRPASGNDEQAVTANAGHHRARVTGTGPSLNST